MFVSVVTPGTVRVGDRVELETLSM